MIFIDLNRLLYCRALVPIHDRQEDDLILDRPLMDTAHRSQYTAKTFADDHQLALEDRDISTIPI